MRAVLAECILKVSIDNSNGRGLRSVDMTRPVMLLPGRPYNAHRSAWLVVELAECSADVVWDDVLPIRADNDLRALTMISDIAELVRSHDSSSTSCTVKTIFRGHQLQFASWRLLTAITELAHVEALVPTYALSLADTNFRNAFNTEDVSS